MTYSTSCLSRAAKLTALACLVFASAIGVNAAAVTFVYNGLVFKSDTKQTTVSLERYNKKLSTGETGAPDDYVGDIIVPTEVVYNGKTMTVTKIGDAFYETSVESVYIPDGIAIGGQGLFSGCSKLKSVRFPAEYNFGKGAELENCIALEEFTVPAGATSLSNNNFKNCISLRKLIFEETETPIAISVAAFAINMKVSDEADAEVYPSALTEVIINRPIDATKFTAMADKPFRNHKALQKVTIGGKCTELPASYFFGTATLTEVDIADTFTSFGTNCFEGTSLTEVTIPAGVTSISSGCFQNCKKLNKVVLHSNITSISDMAFYKSTVADINLNEGLRTIGQLAFAKTKIAGEIALPSTVTSVGIQAFADDAISALSIPAATHTIGDGAFMNCPVASVTVASENETFASDTTNSYVTTGTVLKYYAPAAPGTSLEGNFTELAPYACYGATNLETITIPSCTKFGDYSLYGSGIKAINLNGVIGRYVAAECKNLESIAIDNSTVPFGVAMNCSALKSVSLRPRTSTIQQDAFNGCSALENLDLGLTLSVLESDCFANSGIKNLKVCAPNPAPMSEGVFTPAMDITVTVPIDLVDTYKAAEGWKYLNIAGDASLAQGPSDMGMPAGLYYAGTDNMLHCAYADGQFDTYDVGGIPHTFQLLEYSDRIYGACAGTKFVYSNTGSVDGDGKLFYISKIGGDTFQATVLDNTGGNAYADPFGLYENDGILFVNDRNVSIRKIPASALSLPQSYPGWMENNQLGYYGDKWSYGCIKAGFNITVDPEDNAPLYWVGMKYNGNGIFRFKDSDIGNTATPPAAGGLLTGLQPILTTFQIDKVNNQIYIYIEKAGTGSDDDLSGYVKGGLYRINLADLEANPNPATLAAVKAVLVDGSPVKYEGSSTNEHVGISQLAIDENNEYMYWCYRAPTKAQAEAREAMDYNGQAGGQYWWADKYDETNPLHHSGIKRIKLGEENPVVEMVVPDVEGYGVAAVRYAGSSKTDGVNSIVAVGGLNKVSVVGNEITVDADAKVVVYALNGSIVAAQNLKAGNSYSVANLEAGAYIVAATFANGTVSSAKFVK